MTGADVLAEYADGERTFSDLEIVAAEFTGAHLIDVRFHRCTFVEAVFDRAWLADSTFIDCGLADASLARANLDGAKITLCDLAGARLRYAGLTGVAIFMSDLGHADLTGGILDSARFTDSQIAGMTTRRAVLTSTVFASVDVTPFCDAADIFHHGPSYIEPGTVMRSYDHPGLKRFMVDCGIPSLFAEYMIDCARALDEPMLRNLMRSTFISYGGPDEAFARRLYDALRAHGVVTFFFPETARLGERIDNEVYSRIQEHDRVILVCSRASLDRKGVLNEVQETFDREARDGGATYLLPIMLDDYVLTDWAKTQPTLAERVTRRVVGDFRAAATDDREFDKQLGKLLTALKK
jgi:hypothetical protein